MTRAAGAGLCIALLALLALTACQDNEQRAAREGEAARAAVAAICDSAAPMTAPPDGGSLADDESADEAASEHGSCTHRLCEERCAGQTVPAFHRACVAACTADGVCQSDADCGQGLRCIAVAPVVRRCRPQLTSHPASSATAR